MMFPDTIERAIIADKIAARGWVAEKVGFEHIAPIYDICDSVAELSKKIYAYPYVVKTNHASGQFCLVRDDAEHAEMLQIVPTWDMSEYKTRHEWAYRGIKAKYFVEKMLVDADQPVSIEFKIFCFFGEPVLIRYIKGKETSTKKYGGQRAFLSPEWGKLNIGMSTEPDAYMPEKPAELAEVLRIAKALSADLDFIRVDLMVLGGQVFFGEMTNFPTAGEVVFRPLSFDRFLMEEYQRIRKEKVSAARDKYHKDAGEKLESCR